MALRILCSFESSESEGTQRQVVHQGILLAYVQIKRAGILALVLMLFRERIKSITMLLDHGVRCRAPQLAEQVALSFRRAHFVPAKCFLDSRMQAQVLV